MGAPVVSRPTGLDPLGFLWVLFGAPALLAQPFVGSCEGPLRGPFGAPSGPSGGPAGAAGDANPLGLLQGPLQGPCTKCKAPCGFLQRPPSGALWGPFGALRGACGGR